MDKKKFTTWGVSFASLALVTGMVSYLGFNNKDTNTALNNTNQAQTSNQNGTQQAPSENRNDNNPFGSSTDNNGAAPNFNDDQSENDNGSSFSSGDDQSTQDNGQSGFSGNENNQFAGRGFDHYGGFDTTSGGT